MCNSNWATHCLDCSRRSMMKDNMGYSSHHHWGCLFINCLIFVMTCLWTFLGKLNIETWLLVAWCVIPYWLKSLHLPSVASLLLCVTEWAGRWLYSSPLEALVVLVITGTDRSVISYKYKLFGNIIILATLHMACFHHTCMHRKANICFILHLHV